MTIDALYQKSLPDVIDEAIATWASTTYYRLRSEHGLDDIPAWVAVIRLLRVQDPSANPTDPTLPIGKASQSVALSVQQRIDAFMSKYNGQTITPEVIEKMSADAVSFLEQEFEHVEIPEGGKLLEHIGVNVIPTPKGTQLRFAGYTKFGESLLQQWQTGGVPSGPVADTTPVAQEG